MTSSNVIQVTEGISSVAQEVPMTYGGYDAAAEDVVRAKKEAVEFIRSVKDFSNAAEKARQKD